MGATTAPVYNPKTCSLNLLFVDTHTGLTNESQNPGFFETRPHSLRCGPAALLQCGLFRYVISASIDASFRLVPHESAFFSRTCKPTSLGVVPCQGMRRHLRLRRHGASSTCGFRKAFGRIWHGLKPLSFMHFHAVLLGNQHAMWSKQHNGKVS
jgi:hypothetical protein